MEGIADIIKVLEGALEQLKAMAPEQPEESGEPEAELEVEMEAKPAAPVKESSGGDDGFKSKKGLMVASLKRALTK
jgi:hypothetical protein